MNAPITLTELEERLAAPGGEALLASLAQRLAALEARARAQLEAGLAPAAFQNCAALADAARAAQEVLAAVPQAAPLSDTGAAPAPLPFNPLSR
ncbi:EscE/YscE/SsaE family type III secretion system needle protein co-chaperone [Achromobacter denitrificans]